MSQKDRILELLLDGKPHTHKELYRLGCIAHSRISDLRKDGFEITHWRARNAGEWVSVYQLVSTPLKDPAPLPGCRAGSLSGPEPSAGVEESPLPAPPSRAAQLFLVPPITDYWDDAA